MADHIKMHKHLLQTVPITEAESIYLFNLSKITHLKKKEHLFIAGDMARQVGYVNQGCLRYYRIDEKGDEHIIYFAIENWWIGDLSSFYGNIPTGFNLCAMEPCELYLFTKDVFDHARREIPSFDQYCKIRHAKANDARVETMMSLRYESAEERYKKLMHNFPDIFQRVPQHYIASFLGIKPQSLSRIRKNIRL